MKRKLTGLVAFVAVVFAIVTVLIGSEEVRGTEGDYNQTIETFFSMVEQGQHGEAIDFLYADNPWMSAKSDDIIKLRGQFVGLETLLGSCVGHELMHKESLGDRYAYLWYFVATERQPIAFKFQFYKPADTWLIYSFAYADDIEDWLEERGRVHFCYAGLKS